MKMRSINLRRRIATIVFCGLYFAGVHADELRGHAAALTAHDEEIASSSGSGNAPPSAAVAPKLDRQKTLSKTKSKPKAQAKPPPQPQPIICPACPPVPVQAICPALQAPQVYKGFWSNYGKDIVFSFLGVLLGALVSFYATMIFERYKRFRDTLMDVARARNLIFGAYPTSTSNLQPVIDKATEYWELVRKKVWDLNADGHLEAGKQVGRLMDFADRSVHCMENLLNNKTKGLSGSVYLIEFQRQFKKIYDSNFTSFEKRLKPSWKAVLQPFPHAPFPNAGKAIGVDFFNDLL